MNEREIRGRVAAIRDDRELGATQLAGEAVRLMDELASDRSIPDSRFTHLFPRVARELGQARASMPSLLNASDRVAAAWLEAGGAAGGSAAREAVRVAARRWEEQQELSVAFLADHAAEAISGTVITLSHSLTVMRALEECWNRRSIRKAIVAESRPCLEGRTTAAELAARGIPTSLITDAEIGLFTREASFALVGANAILPDGSLANRAGTLLLALAAHHSRVPFLVLAETHKIAQAGRRRAPIPMEEREPEEVLPDPIAGVQVRNLYLDHTPARYINGYITEQGLLDRRDVAAMARRAQGLRAED